MCPSEHSSESALSILRDRMFRRDSGASSSSDGKSRVSRDTHSSSSRRVRFDLEEKGELAPREPLVYLQQHRGPRDPREQHARNDY